MLLATWAWMQIASADVPLHVSVDHVVPVPDTYQPHHHHEDGGVTVDNSQDSLQHFVLEHAQLALGTCPQVDWICDPVHSEPSRTAVSRWANPWLPGLRRPPRLA